MSLTRTAYDDDVLDALGADLRQQGSAAGSTRSAVRRLAERVVSDHEE